MSGTKCPIWGTLATRLPRTGDSTIVDSPRAGGKYEVTGSAIPSLNQLPQEQKAKLTTWIVDQHRHGVAAPTLHTVNIPAITAAPPLPVAERRDRLLLYIQATAPGIGSVIYLTGSHKTIKPEEKEKIFQELQAWTESISNAEVHRLVDFAHENGFLEGKSNLTLSFEGHQRLEALMHRRTLSEQAFVAMWFDPQMRTAYEHGFAQAIREAGYRPLRVDQEQHIDKIDDKIIAEIRRSRFLVADFTCEVISYGDKPIGIGRGGVYYEAGFAQGLNIPVIWTCRKDAIFHVHFDTRQYNHIVWTKPDDLREQLRDRISATIGDGPLVVT